MAETTTEVDAGAKRFSHYGYPAMTKTQGSFSLHVEAGEFTDSEILVMLGENGTGKTTFIRMLHGSLTPDEDGIEVPEFKVSYKPQKISPKFPGSVRAPLPLVLATTLSLDTRAACRCYSEQKMCHVACILWCWRSENVP